VELKTRRQKSAAANHTNWCVSTTGAAASTGWIPDMPPFDESKFEPMPEVEINPKDEYWVDPDKLE